MKKRIKRRFKQGVGAVPGELGRWDINFQVAGKRVTERIQASDYDEALNIRLQKKRSEKNRQQNIGDPVYDLQEVFKMLMKEIEDRVALGSLQKKEISSIGTRFQRFFFDYPKHLGREWKTTEDFTEKDFEGYERYYGNILNRKRGVSSEMRHLKNIFSHLYKMGFIKSEKFFNLKQIKCPPKNHTPFVGNPDSDFEAVFSEINKTHPRTYDFFVFGALTGRRPKEVRNLLREFVSMEHFFIFVNSDTKNKDFSRIPFNDPDLKRVVSRAMDFSRKLDSKYLFLNEQGKQFSANNPARIFKAAAKACGIPNWQKWTPYQLKKRLITTLRAKNYATEAISLLTGHKDLDSVIKHYSFPDQSVTVKLFEAGKLRIK